MPAKIEAKVTHRLQASAERVYDAWLDPTQVRAWMAAALKSFGLAGDMRQIEIDAQVGGEFTFSDMRDGVEARHWGTYLALDRPSRISFTWITAESEEADPSTVMLTFHPEGEGCTALLVHQMDAKWAEYLARTESGWARMLDYIDKLL